MAAFHERGSLSCHYLLGTELVLPNTCHPGYSVRENMNIPTNLCEVVPLLAWYMIYHNTIGMILYHTISDTCIYYTISDTCFIILSVILLFIVYKTKCSETRTNNDSTVSSIKLKIDRRAGASFL